MTKTAEQTASENKIIVVPSNVYNNKIYEILKEVASRYDNLSVRAETAFSETKYKIVSVDEGVSMGFDPFASTETKCSWSLVYDTSFTRHRMSDKSFYQVQKKQVFVGEAAFEAHFEEIRDSVDKAVAEVIAGEAQKS